VGAIKAWKAVGEGRKWSLVFWLAMFVLTALTGSLVGAAVTGGVFLLQAVLLLNEAKSADSGRERGGDG